MKIGLFTDTFYPEINGVATSCLTLERELTKRGHEVPMSLRRSARDGRIISGRIFTT